MYDRAEFWIRVEKLLYLVHKLAFLLTITMAKKETNKSFLKFNKSFKNFKTITLHIQGLQDMERCCVAGKYAWHIEGLVIT